MCAHACIDSEYVWGEFEASLRCISKVALMVCEGYWSKYVLGVTLSGGTQWSRWFLWRVCLIIFQVFKEKSRRKLVRYDKYYFVLCGHLSIPINTCRTDVKNKKQCNTNFLKLSSFYATYMPTWGKTYINTFTFGKQLGKSFVSKMYLLFCVI